MNKFDMVAEKIADRVWVVLEEELANDAITERELRRVFTRELADVLASVLVEEFMENVVPALCESATCACGAGVSPRVLPATNATSTSTE